MWADLTPEDRALFDETLRDLPVERALVISKAAEPPWRLRQRRLDARDNAIRELASLSGVRRDAAARVVYGVLECHFSARRDKLRSRYDLSAECARQRELLDLVFALNDGDDIGLSQVRNILAGHRGDYAAQKSGFDSVRAPEERGRQRGG